MKKLLFAVLLFGFTFLVPYMATNGASAQFDPLEKPCAQGSDTSDSAVCKEAKNTENPLVGSDGVLTTVANLLAIAAGIIAVIIIIIAGIGLTLSAGDSNKVSSNRNAIIYAAVGIVIIVVARSIVLFIINRIG